MATEQVISKVDMQRIDTSYTIPQPDELRELLARHPHVIPALLEAPARVKETFGARLRGIVLEKVPDYDEGEDLFSVMALVKATPEEALELRSAMDEWLLEQPGEVRLMVAFGVAPV